MGPWGRPPTWEGGARAKPRTVHRAAVPSPPWGGASCVPRHLPLAPPQGGMDFWALFIFKNRAATMGSTRGLPAGPRVAMLFALPCGRALVDAVVPELLCPPPSLPPWAPLLDRGPG